MKRDNSFLRTLNLKTSEELTHSQAADCARIPCLFLLKYHPPHNNKSMVQEMDAKINSIIEVIAKTIILTLLNLVNNS